MRSRAVQILAVLTLAVLAAGCSSTAQPKESEFQWNTGEYLSPPDVVATRTAGKPITLSCPGGPFIVYAYHGRWVANSANFELMAVQNPNVAEAAHVAKRYARNHVTCARGCEMRMKYIWAGWDCRHAPGKGPAGLEFNDSAAVELAVWCVGRAEPEIEGLEFEDPNFEDLPVADDGDPLEPLPEMPVEMPVEAPVEVPRVTPAPPPRRPGPVDP